MIAFLAAAGATGLAAVALLVWYALRLLRQRDEARAEVARLKGELWFARTVRDLADQRAQVLSKACEDAWRRAQIAESRAVDAQSAARCWMEIARRHGHHVRQSPAN